MTKKCSSFVLSAILPVFFLVGCQTPSHRPEGRDQNLTQALNLALRTANRPIKSAVIVDSFDVPHAYADTKEDLYFLQGFIHAYFRIWQMEFRSRLAEGTSGLLVSHHLTEDDKFAQRADLLWVAQKIENEILNNPELRSIALAYSEGVNARIQQLINGAPPPEYVARGLQPRRWGPRHIALSIVSALFGQARPTNELRLTAIKNTLTAEQFRQFFSGFKQRASSANDRSKDHFAETVTKYDLELHDLHSSSNTGSNAFVIHGDQTASGKQIAANDFHLDYIVPTILLPMQMTTPEFNAFGATSIGIPGIISGTNRHMSWTTTSSMADSTDWFRLRFRDQSRKEYWWNGRWEKVVSQLRTTPLEDGKTAVVEVRKTAAGPLLPIGGSGDELALSWTGAAGKTTFFPFIRLPQSSHADSCGNTDVLESISHMVLTCIDRKNSIGEWSGGSIPKRNTTMDPRLVNNASLTKHIWDGFHPVVDNPKKFPVAKYSISANTRLDTSGRFIYQGWEYAAPFRFNRIKNLLTESGPFTPEKAIGILSDIEDYRYKEVTPLLLRIFDADKPNERCESELMTTLTKWDGRYTANSELASLYVQILTGVERRLLPSSIAELGELPGSVRLGLMDTLHSGLTNQRTDVVDAARSSVADICQSKKGARRWGRTNTVLFRSYGSAEPLSADGLEAPGALSTVFSQARVHGTVWRMVTELDERPRIWFSSIGQLRGETSELASQTWMKRWTKQEMDEIPFFEPKDFLNTDPF